MTLTTIVLFVAAIVAFIVVLGLILAVSIPAVRALGSKLVLKVPEDELDAVRKEVETSGPAFVSFSCSRNYIGAVALSDAAVTFDGHPGGLIVRPTSMHPFALRKADISRIERRSIANQTMLYHTSTQVAGPIVINMPFDADEIKLLVSILSTS